MSSKRDLVEAHSFNRRRLITAFVSGAPGGREVEPVRYGRTLVGGAVLALLLLAGAAVSGFIKPAVPPDWTRDKLVIGKTSGARFVAYQDTLYPVINTTSARLLLSRDGRIETVFVPDDRIAAVKQGPTIGIPGAPDVVPVPDALVQSGWSACTDDGQGVLLGLQERAGIAAVQREALVVESGGSAWVITGRHRHLLPEGGRRDAVLRALGLEQEPPREVPGIWLDLVPPGEPFEPVVVPGQGARVETGVSGLDRVGTPMLVDGQPYLLGRDARLVRLTPVAYRLYRSTGPGAAFEEVEVAAADVAGLRAAGGESPFPADWPEEDLRPMRESRTPCLLLSTAADEAPYVELAGPRGVGADLPEIEPGTVTQEVQAGHGALVRATTAGVIDAGTVFLVDATGTRFALGGRTGATAAQTALGYAEVTPRAVPKAWTELFRDGPVLSSQAAGEAQGGAQGGAQGAAREESEPAGEDGADR